MSEGQWGKEVEVLWKGESLFVRYLLSLCPHLPILLGAAAWGRCQGGGWDPRQAQKDGLPVGSCPLPSVPGSGCEKVGTAVGRAPLLMCGEPGADHPDETT